jgi:predicted dehydrogenase
MVEACRRRGVRLIVNHQRRLKADLLMARRLIEAGAIGQVCLIRATHAGDVLSDGTHAVDSIRHLAGDRPAKWVFGAICRPKPKEGEPKGTGYHASGGYRYGHPIESAAMATWEFEGGPRAELLAGDLRFPGRPYQDHEILGTQGRLWRVGDRNETPLLIENHEGRGFRVVDLNPEEAGRDPMTESYRLLARQIREGGEHPLSGDSGLADLEVVMAIYESARLRKPVTLPLTQEEYPLEIMIRDGQA